MAQDSKTPITGAELSLYYVATVRLNNKNNLSYTFSNTFEDCGCALDDPSLSTKLDTFVKDNSVSAAKLVTDAHGNVTFPNLPLGLYFVKQIGQVEGFAPCAPFLVTVPMYAAGGYEYHVNATPKTEVQRLFSITIKKVWNTDSRTEAADSVTVQLLLNGNAVATSVLSEENNWQVTYTDLPESDRYSVKELHVPKGFTATYKKNGNVFTVTNTSTLIKTGQLIWPIPVLAICGVLLLSVGTWLLQKKRKTHE